MTMDGGDLIAAELEAELAGAEVLAQDPVYTASVPGFHGDARKLRSRLYAELEVSLALSLHPGAEAGERELERCRLELLQRSAALRDAWYRLSGIDPVSASRDPQIGVEAYRIGREACRWVCRHWRLEKAGVVPPLSAGELVDLAGHSEEVGWAALAEASERSVGTRVAVLRAFTRIAEAFQRFDFLCQDLQPHIDAALRMVQERARAAHAAMVSHDPTFARDAYGFESLLLSAADIYYHAHLSVAREVVKSMLQRPREEVQQDRLLARLQGGISQADVRRSFDTLFSHAIAVVCDDGVEPRPLGSIGVR